MKAYDKGSKTKYENSRLHLFGADRIGRYATGSRRMTRVSWDGKAWQPVGDRDVNSVPLNPSKLWDEPCWHTCELYAVGKEAVVALDGQVLGAISNIQDQVNGKWAPVMSGGFHLYSGSGKVSFRRVEEWDCAEIPVDVKKATAGGK